MQYKLLLYLLLFSILNSNIYASIQLIKKENSDSNTTLLVIAGIHGNEPGGFFSASILATNYTIKSKNLWIIPNLNQESIIKNRRGIHGDMNRKFSVIKKNDKDKNIIRDVKKIILSKKVSLVLNLHDGHGFYRKKNQGSIFNPTAWGQTCVIDQCNLKQDQEFGNLNTIALTVKDNVNKKLIQKHHSFNVKNTKTKYIDEAMQLSLTYFAVTNNKPAFAIETSKNLSSLSQKVFYQLLAIEEFMKIMHIKFERNFEFTEKNIKKMIVNYGSVSINGNINLSFRNIKKSLRFIPIKSRNNNFVFSHPLGGFRKVRGNYELYVGNKRVTVLKPDYFKISKNCPKQLDVVIDGKAVSIKAASDLYVNTDFKVIKDKMFRANIIGFRKKGHINESGLNVNFKNLDPNYSVDRKHKVYRLEIYDKNKFCSMSMIHFK